MVPVANRPILEHLVDGLDAAGVSEIVLVVGSNSERVQSHFGDGQEWDLDISYVIQEQQLGTGHALLQAESHVGESFIALNGDRIIDAELISQIWEQHQATRDVVMGVTRVDEPSRYGVVELDGQDVVGIEEHPIPALAKSDLINAGVYAFTPDIFAAIRRTNSHGEQALTDTLAELMDSRRIRAVHYRGMWLDVSEPWDLLDVNDSLIAYQGPPDDEPATVDDSAIVAEAAILGDGVVVHPQAAVLRGVTLGDNVSVGPGVILENAVILSDVTLKAGAVVTDCIVGANTVIGPNTTVEGGTTDVVLDDAIYRDVTFGGLLGDNVDVGGNVTVEPGTVVGNDATIDSAAVISGRIDDDSHVMRG